MTNVRRSFWGIVLVTLLAVVLNIPAIPVNFQIGSWKVDTELFGSTVDLSGIGLPFQRDISVRQGLDLQGGTQVTLRLDMSDVPEDQRDTAADSAASVMEQRVNYTGATEAVVQPAHVGDDYLIRVELPGVKDAEQAVALVGQTAKLEFREVVDQEAAASGFITMETTAETGLSGEDLERAVVDTTTNPMAPQVAITFTSEGTQEFAALTERLVGQPLAIFLDEALLTAPTIQTPIRDGQAVISGQFSIETARQLALTLSAGALPVPIEVIEQRTIGATLGQETVERSIVAGIVGLLLVMLYMGLYYRKLGLIANVALIMYALFMLALIRWIPITLTLSGIAGFILSVGMAVDANILIFERLREELRRGNKMRAAIEIGFDRAWLSIRDSNVATMITCAILYGFGTGQVRGFALTLGLGVLVSMFTAVVATRTFLRISYGGGKLPSVRKLHPQVQRYTSRLQPATPREG